MAKILRQNPFSVAKEGTVREVKMVSGRTGYTATRRFNGTFEYQTFSGLENSRKHAISWAGLEEVEASDYEKSKVLASFKVTMENWDGKCKRVLVSAANECEAFAVAQLKYKTWTPVEAVAV